MFTATEMRKRYIIYIRGILSLLIILLSLYKSGMYLESPVFVVVYLSLLLLSNFVLIIFPVRFFTGIKMHYIVFLLDIIFVVLGAYAFTDLDGTFLVAVFLGIFISALSQSVGLSILIAVVVNALYFYIRSQALGAGLEAFSGNVLLNIPFIFMVCMHSSYLAETANQDIKEKLELEKINRFLSKKIKSSNDELAAGVSFTYGLIDSIRWGIIMIDNKGFVRIINSWALEILGQKKANYEGEPLNELVFLGKIKDEILNFKFTNEEADRKLLSIDINGTVKELEVSTMPAGDKDGVGTGIICIFREKKAGS